MLDQIPGFSALSTRDSTSSSSSLVGLSSSTELSSSKSSRTCLPRVRYFEDSPQSLSESTSPDFGLSLPFFDKKNPTRFLDIVKGVSARVDENAGVGRKDGPRSAEMTRKFGKKRPRTASFGNLSEPKRGRLGSSSSATKENVSINSDKGKGRGKASHQNGDASSDSTRSLQGHQSMPNVCLPQDLFSKSAEYPGQGVSKHGDLEGQGTLRTPSQTKMPPPPAPLRQPPCSKHNSAHLSYSSIDKQTPTAPKSSDPTKSDPTPKLHPLLLPKSPSNSCSRSKSHPRAPVGHQPRTNSFPHENGNLGVSQANILPTPAPLASNSSSNPSTAGKLSSRLPVLGMRRTHSHPCHSSLNQNLPTKQKGFKPPLMSSSQPQARSQQSQGKSLKTEPTISAAFRKHSGNMMESLASQAPPCSNGSTSSESFRSTPPMHTSPTSLFDSPVPSVEHAADIHEVAVAPVSASSPLSASINGDSDSSFGDTSFDLDALEETMRMYD